MIGNVGASSIDELLKAGWDSHDTEGERLASELEAEALAEIAPDLLTPFLHLAVHTIGEHLGDWPRALALGKRVLGGRTAVPETAKAWGWLYVAAVLAGNAIEAADFELSYLRAAGDDFGAALLDMRFMLAQVLIGAKRSGEGVRIYRHALNLVEQIPHTALLDHTIAITSNNLGWELYEMPSHGPDDDCLMQISAKMSLKFWLKCGNWVNAERAHYLNALVANVVGDPKSGLMHADTALAIIAANGERPLDAGLLHLARATSLAALGDTEGKTKAITAADAAAAKLSGPKLKAQFAAERAKVVKQLGSA